MNMKRILTLLLALCLAVSLMAPAATAVEAAPEDALIFRDPQTGSQAAGNTGLSSLIASAADALGIHTLRDDQLNVSIKGDDISYSDGKWIATAADGSAVELSEAELPRDIQILRKAADTYCATDAVAAFVVLEEDPTAERYSSINDVPEEETAALLQRQELLLQTISSQILDGQAPSVLSRFTYLTNSVVIETAFGNLEPIAALEGVKSVFLSPVYSACETTAPLQPYTLSSNSMTGVSSVWQDLGFTGTGITIAVLDTGLDLDHPAFAADPALTDSSWTQESVQALLDRYDLQLESLYGQQLSAEDIYYNAKVPFYFNYAMGTTNVSHNDGVGDHGTHVAGIAAANNVEGSGVAGMAPDAQIIAMKVFSASGGANMYTIVRALEDCMTMEVDVANLSLGSPAGFTVTGIEEIDAIFARIASTDMIVDVAAGNEGTSSYGSGYGPNLQPTDYTDNSTVSSPSTYYNTVSVGSVDNALIPADYFTLADGTDIFYTQSIEFLYGYIDFTLTILAGKSFDYVVIDGLGYAEDFYDENGNSLVEGKIAVIRRGTITFGEKIANAEAAGAAAAMIWNNVSEDIFLFGMTTSYTNEAGEEVYPGIPAILISLEDGKTMADAAEKRLSVPEGFGYRADPAGGQVSSFSSWGVSSDLRLLPDISGVGGNVFSCYDGGLYGLMSGTSMATPQVAGVTALVKQYLQQTFPDASTEQIRLLVSSLMMSTAVPVVDSDTGVEASPRQQGAGLVNALNALTAEAYLSVAGSEKPKGELGDSADGTYSFTFTVSNFSQEAKTYSLNASLLCEDYITDEAYPDIYFLAQQDRALDASGVSFDRDQVTVPAGGSADITVTIRLTEADKNWIDTYFPCGNYVEGYVYLKGEEEITLSIPFLGYYGSWNDSDLFDSGFWYQDGLWMETDTVEANEYYHILWTSLGSSTQDWIFGLNPYAGMQFEYDDQGNPVKTIYSDRNNVLSPNGDGLLDSISDMYLSIMRNAEWINLTYTDAEGNVLDRESLDKNAKTMYISGYGSVIPMVYSWYYDSLYDFRDENGDLTVSNGDVVYLTISGVISYEGAEEQILCKLPVHIDTEAPKLDTDSIVETSDETGNYLTLTVEDAHPAYLALMNYTGTQIYARYTDLDMVDNGDGTYCVTIDVTGMGDSFSIALCDYGCNEAYYQLSYTLTDNYPQVSEQTLYAYQVYNESIHAYYGWDYMFGWSAIDKQSAQIEMISSDVYEYYSLTAAEYAGGYIFGVDAGYNLLYMKPGLFNRNLICNLGVNVLDMAFDEVTQTMYLTTKTGSDYCLYTVDLLTGELELKKAYDSYYFMPWAMTFADGQLYCCKYYYNGFYQVDIAGGTYELSPVTLEDGTTFQPITATGEKVTPFYSQSMTYSPADGLIYWAYYDGEDGFCLITIDPETWTSSAVAFAGNQEYVGLLTVEDDGYTLPESTQITNLVIDREQMIMATGDTQTLTVVLLPWNAPAGNVTWTSSDETVAVVDADGVVTALTEGEAVITATYEDLSVSCNVAVVNVKGNLYAYNYYSGDGSYGNFMSIDLEDMSCTDLCYSDTDFIAADYNGHHGLIYGFDEFGGYYSCDPETGECIRLGSSDIIPADMAYDYSTGLMYAIAYDFTYGNSTLYAVSPSSGKLVKVATVGDLFITLACDSSGVLYGITYYGELYRLTLDEAGLTEEFILQTPAESIFYAQSMCYDHNNDVLLWASVENSTIYWIDIHAQNPYCLSIGAPYADGYFEYVGLYVIPDEIAGLDNVSATGIEVDDMILLVGDSKAPSVTVYPLNATEQSNITYRSANTDVVTVEDGRLVGVSPGSATVRATLTVGSARINTTFTVTVKESTGSLQGFLLSDLANMDGYYWIDIDETNPTEYTGIDYVYYNGTYMLLYAAEYVDGYIYAYGFDYNSWDAHFQFMVINAKTWSVLECYDMGSGFGFVYDMAFDYTTGTMYALMGPGDTATNLYYVNLDNGQLIPCMSTEPLFMSLAIDAEGTIYAMEGCAGGSDELSTSTAGTSKLYTLDPENGSCKVFMDTGYGSNMLASMTYDYDTGYIYWTGIKSDTAGYESGLYLIDLAEKKCYDLGTIGGAGAQVTGLISISQSYPQIPDTLQHLALMSDLEELAVGGQVTLETFVQPAGLEVTTQWSCADPSVATVSDKGVVTGVSAGITTVFVTVTDSSGNSLTIECTIVVYGADDYFLTYNHTDGGFTAIARPNSTVTTNLCVGEELPGVTSMEMVEGVIYAYDENGDLFITARDAEFQRTYIGNHGIPSAEPAEKHSEYTGAGYTYGYDYYYTYDFVVRDMAWDAANQRLLALGCSVQNYETYYWYESETESEYYLYDAGQNELSGGCRIYQVDLQTGALTELVTVGGEQKNSGVTMLAIADDGQAYIYSYFRDYVAKLDLQTGATTNLTSFQGQSFYGNSNGELMAMTYDSVTDDLYMLITDSGKVYYLYKFVPETGAIERVGTVGKVAAYHTDSFAGLVLNQEHGCEYTLQETKDATCTEDGYRLYRCDHGITYTQVIPATGHSHTVTDSKDATCTEDGYVIYTCPDCGDTYTETTSATGHSHTVTDSKEATCTEDGYVTYTCPDCGDTYTQTVPATGHTHGQAVEENRTEATEDENGSYDSVIYCTQCGQELSRETVTIPATGGESPPSGDQGMASVLAAALLCAMGIVALPTARKRIS